MATVNGSQILARALRAHGVDTMFYLMGGPMMQAELSCMDEGIRSIDVRHEQAAAMMAHAYSRVTSRVGVCMAASGPGTANMLTGVANAWADACPILAIGGAAPARLTGRGVFQECDQLSIFRPVTKWSDRCLDANRIPDLVSMAMRQARRGKPGPVYLEMPGDVLYQDVDDATLHYREDSNAVLPNRAGDLRAVQAAIQILRKAERPIVVSGTGALWSEAGPTLQAFVEMAGIPFYTTPQGRGVVPEDHGLCLLAARSEAFREADCVLIVGTRMNWINAHFQAPRFNANARLIQIDIDPTEIGTSRPVDVAIVGDARTVLEQLVVEGQDVLSRSRTAKWIEHLQAVNHKRTAAQELLMSSDAEPIHPLRLCKEVRDVIDRDAYLVVDGQEILNFGRQSIPTYAPRHRLNSGTWGTMGVGIPFAIGAKIARPDKQVVVLEGDGSFGLNGMELDTAVRHKVNVVCVISLNGGWTADPQRVKPGRDLGYTRYDKVAEALGCHGEYVEKPSEIRPALERALAAGVPAVVNVKTDPNARAATAKYTARDLVT